MTAILRSWRPALIFLLLCIPARRASSQQITAQVRPRDLPDIVAATTPSVGSVFIYNSSGKRSALGTAFAIGPGRFLTNHHVIEGASAADISLPTVGTVPVTGLLADDPAHDLALLFCPDAIGKIPALLLQTELPREGERVAVIGSPLGLERTVSEGIVSAVRHLVDIGDLIQITAPISPGSSGSPVLDMSGKVIAIVVAQLVHGQALNFSIPAKYGATLHAAQARPKGSLGPQGGTANPKPMLPPERQPTPVPSRPAAPTWYSDAAEVLRQANSAWEKERWEQAAKLYDRLLELFPDHPVALERGRQARQFAEEARRQADEARQRRAEEQRVQRERALALAREKANIPLYRETARTYLKAGQLGQAFEWAKRIEAVDPADPFVTETRSQLTELIISKNMAFLGGLEKLRRVETVRMIGTVAVGDAKVALVSLWKRPNLRRNEIRLGDTTILQAYDGAVGWIAKSFEAEGGPQRMSNEDLAHFQSADFEGPLVDSSAKGNTIELEGISTVQGAESWCLRVTTKSGDVSLHYVDTSRYSEVEEEEEFIVAGVKQRVLVFVEDYRDTDGLMFPCRIRTVGTGPSTNSTIVFEQVQLNPPLDVKLFGIPTS